MKQPKVVAIGTATFDAFLIGEALAAKRDVRTHDEVEQFPLGAKIEVDDMEFSTGGGAANAAVTFARQGFDTRFIGKIGDDLAGREVLAELENERVKTNFIVCDLEGETGFSTILLASSGERTILVYRGVSEDLGPKEVDFNELEADWFYISSLAGNLKLLKTTLSRANAIGAKVAYNPGGREISKAGFLKPLLKQVDVLVANRQEMQQLFGKTDAPELLQLATALVDYAVLTDGPRGSWLAHANQLHYAGMYQDVKVVDRTGAGDAFSSGLVAQLAQGKNIEESLTFASANSTSVVQQIGAKIGILHRHAKLKPMSIKVSQL